MTLKEKLLLMFSRRRRNIYKNRIITEAILHHYDFVTQFANKRTEIRVRNEIYQNELIKEINKLKKQLE